MAAWDVALRDPGTSAWDISLSAGASEIIGTLSVTLGAATLAGTGVVDVQGTLRTTLGTATLSGIGVIDVQGTLTTKFADATLSATGTVATPGAFPTTSLLDNFNRTNEGPPPSASWSYPVYPWDNGLRVVSNQCVNNGAWSDAYWNTDVGDDEEWWATFASLGSDDSRNSVYGRIANPNSTSLRGYYVEFTPKVGAGADEWRIFRADSSTSSTQLVATVTGHDLAAGDGFGIELVGSTIKGYKYVSGSWSEVLSRTDSTYLTGGYGAIGVENNAIFDDFGGGTVVVSGASGNLNVTLGTATLSGIGVVSVQGTLTTTLAVATLSATGTVASSETVGNLDLTLYTLTLSGIGVVSVQGTLTTTLAVATLSATGTVASSETVGNLDLTLYTLTLSGIG